MPHELESESQRAKWAVLATAISNLSGEPNDPARRRTLFAALYDWMVTDVWVVSRKLRQSWQDADAQDILQEALFRLFRRTAADIESGKIDPAIPDKQFSAMMRSRLHWCRRNAQRNALRNRPITHEDKVRSIDDLSWLSSPPISSQYREHFSRINKWLASLSTNDRTLLARWASGEKFKITADLRGESEISLRQRVHRLITEARQRMGGDAE